MAVAKKTTEKKGKKKKHMKTSVIGVETSIQFRKDMVIFTMRVPKERLTARLMKQWKATH